VLLSQDPSKFSSELHPSQAILDNCKRPSFYNSGVRGFKSMKNSLEHRGSDTLDGQEVHLYLVEPQLEVVHENLLLWALVVDNSHFGSGSVPLMPHLPPLYLPQELQEYLEPIWHVVNGFPSWASHSSRRTRWKGVGASHTQKFVKVISKLKIRNYVQSYFAARLSETMEVCYWPKWGVSLDLRPRISTGFQLST
jgi:hypothetical protein